MEQERWSRGVAFGAAAVSAVAYAWATGEQQPELFYAAAVRSMAASWHNFFFAAFDPAATMSIDKLPGAFWLQALAVRVFGLHLWVLNLPAIVEGAGTVLVLHRAVGKLAGPVAAAVAAAVYAVTPATIAANRGNVSDPLLILLQVCALNAATSSVASVSSVTSSASGRTRPLLACGLWVGLAFQAKMLQAWLVLPGIVAVWLVTAGPTVRRRVGAAAGLLAVTGLVSVSWMLVVSAVPGTDRPYVDGSRHDSVFAQVFEYNGFSRAGSSAPQGSAQVAAVTRAATLDDYPRVDRLLAGPGGRAVGWLLPVALASLAWLVLRRRRGDPLRATALLWGSWLVLDAAAFLVVNTINAYYLAALTPAVAALTGAGVAAVLELEPERRRTVAVAASAVTVGYAGYLLAPAPGAVLVAVTVALVVAVALLRRHLVAAAVVATLVAPAVAGIALVVDHGGPFDTPFEPGARGSGQLRISTLLADSRTAMAGLEAANVDRRYVAAAYTSLLAAPLIFVSGKEILPVGGFTGSTPAPTLTDLQREIRAGRLRTFLLLEDDDARVLWVRRTCLAVRGRAQGVSTYFCTAG